MGHTYTNLAYHIVFSTKERRDFLSPEIRRRLTPFIGGIIRQRDGRLDAMNGTANHVHLLAALSPKRPLSDQVRDIKALSSGWIKDIWPSLKLFGWQSGYGAFTVSSRDSDNVVRYIESQESHHHTVTFEEEFIGMLELAGIEYDPKFVFD